MGEKVKVLAASEDARCLDTLALVLQNQADIALIGEAGNWRELSGLLTALRPDVVLLDTDAPGPGAAAVIRTARLRYLPTTFVGLVGEMDVDGALLNQLDAVILKSDPLQELTATILAVSSGRGPEPKDQGPFFTSTPAPTPPLMDARPPREPSQSVPPPAPAAVSPTGGGNGTGHPLPPGGHPGVAGDLGLRTPDQSVGVFERPTAPSIPAMATPAAVEAERLRSKPVAPPSTAVEPAPEDGADLTLRQVLPSAGSTVLIASTFGSFRSLSMFQQALERLECVRSVRVRRFQGGTLYAAVRYNGAVEELKEQLKTLVQFDPEIVASRPGMIELRVNAGDGPVAN